MFNVVCHTTVGGAEQGNTREVIDSKFQPSPMGSNHIRSYNLKISLLYDYSELISLRYGSIQ